MQIAPHEVNIFMNAKQTANSGVKNLLYADAVVSAGKKPNMRAFSNLGKKPLNNTTLGRNKSEILFGVGSSTGDRAAEDLNSMLDSTKYLRDSQIISKVEKYAGSPLRDS
jgi:hypothetical protein